MLFYLNQFELHLPESILKRGFRLFCQQHVKEIDHKGHFIIQQKQTKLQIKNNQLQSFTCTCDLSNYCEHLAAGLFYLQQQKLNLEEELFLPVRKNSDSKPFKDQFEALQQIIFRASLVEFSEKGKKSANAFYYFEAFVNLLRSNLKAFHAKVPLQQNQIDELLHVLKHATQLIKMNDQKDLSEEWCLAVFTFFQYLHDFRFSGDEIALMRIQAGVQTDLSSIYSKGLNAKQKSLWFKALRLSLQSNKLIKSKAFYFLVPRYLLVSNKQEDLKIIDELLKSRNYVKPYDEAFNSFEIVKHVLHIKIHGLPKKINFEKLEAFDSEYFIALMEVHFLKNKLDKAFELVDATLLHLQKKQVLLLRYFTTFAIDKCMRLKLPDMELKYLRFSLCHNLQLNNYELDRFIALIPEKKQTAEVDALIDNILKHQNTIGAEKLIKLLLIKKDDEALLQFLLKEKKQFHLLHELLLKDPLRINNKVMTIYAEQLGHSLKTANTFARQKQLLDACKVLFEKLNAERLQSLFELVLTQTGYESQIGKYLTNMFDVLLDLKNQITES